MLVFHFPSVPAVTDTGFFAPDKARGAAFRRKYRLSDDQKVVVSAGHFMQRKGILEFIALARALPLVEFYWFGYTPPALVPAPVRHAMAAAPSAPVSNENAESRREADLLVADPVRAYKEQADSLARRLGALREVELARTDRRVPDYSVEPILQVKNLSIGFPRHGDVHVVDNVSFDVRPGQCMALVGESGCGKSITTKTIMNLLPFVLILYIDISSGDYLNIMYESPAGRIVMTFCLILLCVSYILSQKILNIRV